MKFELVDLHRWGKFIFKSCMKLIWLLIGLFSLTVAGWGQALASSEAKLKWNFQNIEIKALLQSLAEIGQHNLIVADGVTGQVSLHLRDMTWREALQVVVSAKGLIMTDKAGVLWISAPVVTSENLQTLAIPLKYAKALDIAQRLQVASAGAAAGAISHRWMSAKGTVMAEPRTNQLFFLDTPAYLKQLQTVIQQLDVPVRQVLIEAKIVEAEEQFGKIARRAFGWRICGQFCRAFFGFGTSCQCGCGCTGSAHIGRCSARLFAQFAGWACGTSALCTAIICRVFVQCRCQPVFKLGNFGHGRPMAKAAWWPAPASSRPTKPKP
jgi:type IV pilus assembly protein PilQ